LPQGGRAAAEIDRGELAGIGLGAAVEFGNDGVAIALVGRLADLDREVTVRAQLAAPREMKVDA